MTVEQEIKLAVARSRSNDGLGLIGNIAQSLKALYKQLRTVVWKAVTHKPVWVFFAIAMISLPCTAETPAINGAKVAHELTSSGNVVGVDLKQSSVENMTTKRHPTVKTGESARINSSAEGGGGGSKANLVTDTKANIAAKASDKDSAENSVGIGEQINHGALLGLLIALWIIFSGDDIQKPNV